MPSTHAKISYAKSAIRILGYAVLLFLNSNILTFASALLIAAECLGVIEETGL